jgi:hypothetical protein
LVIAKSKAPVTLGNLSQVYDGSGKRATATTVPADLTVNFTYNGNATAPTNAGNYTVIGTVAEANYAGSATNTLVIAKAPAAVMLGSLSQVYDGSAKSVSVATMPINLAVILTYSGDASAPTNAGDYTVIGTVAGGNYTGSATNTLTIAQATLNVTADNQSRAYGLANPPLTVSYSGFVNGEDTNVLSGSPALSTTAVTESPAGTYPITITQGTLDSANYSFNFGNGTLTVTGVLPFLITSVQLTNGVVTITWSSVAGQTYRLQYKESWADENWTDIPPDVGASDTTATGTNAVDAATQRLYRVKWLGN